MFTRVCGAEAVFEGGTRFVIVGGQLVMLAWPENGELKAFQGVCPHTAQPLVEDQFDGRVLTCPVHGWTWDMTNGAPVHPRESALAEYPLKVEEGSVYVDADGVAPLFAPR